MTRIRERYVKEVVPELKKEFGYTNDLSVPRLEKIVVNVGVGRSLKDPKHIEFVTKALERITGQKPSPRKARLSISGFKIRKGMVVGLTVTLRGTRMDEFFDRLVNISLPRVRDFRGINDKSFDGRGNYSMGITEQIIFPEVDLDKVNKITGMDVTFVTTAKTDAEALALLKMMGLPFRNQRN